MCEQSADPGCFVHSEPILHGLLIESPAHLDYCVSSNSKSPGSMIFLQEPAMRPILLIVLSLSLIMITFAISADVDKRAVEIVVLNEKNWDQFAPQGKEVDAIYGDMVIRNDHLSAVIARPVATRNANMTVRNVGGCLIDLAARSFESDQLSCFYPAGNDFIYREWNVTAGEAQSQAVSSDLHLQGKSGEVSVISVGREGRPTVRTTYRLTESSTSLQIITEYINHSQKTITLVPTDLVRADGGKELMVKTPNGTGRSFSIDDQFWQQAYILTPAKDLVQSNSNSRTSTLKYLDEQGRDLNSISPAESMVIERSFAVGKTYLDAARAAGLAAYRTGQLRVLDGFGQPVADAVLHLSQGPQDLGQIRTNSTGLADSALPIGTCQIEIRRFGHLLSNGKQELVIEAGSDIFQTTITLDEYRPGLLEFAVRDDAGAPLPVKIEIVGQGDTLTPDFGPESAEFAVKNLLYAHHGQVLVSLPPGEYLVRVSRGPEYSMEEFTVQVPDQGRVAVSKTLYRVVETPGWVSADYHSHSTPSGDNTSSQLGRVLNLVCENIEFAPCTEHNRIDSYQPHFDALQINPWIASVSGMELTGSPLPLNHQNVFPLHHHPHRQDGGGPVTDGDVETQIRRLVTWEESRDKLIQQDHPDIGWLFYDKNADGQHDAGHAGGVALIDVMEIHPIDRVLQTGTLAGMTAETAKSNRIFQWLQLLNQGYRIPGVVNTDAHYNYHGSGWIRNWVQSSTDDPAKIDHMEMVHASEQGRVIMSNGPFLELTARSGEGAPVGVGQDLQAPSQEVTLDLSVQCPNWLSVNTVFLLLNGKPRQDLIFTSTNHPELFVEQGEGTRRKQIFQKQVTVKLAEDTHLIAVAGGPGNNLGTVFGPAFGNVPPAALTNPIFVDIDGNGFQANKETLGRSLPVKGD